MQFTLRPGLLTFADLRELVKESTRITLDPSCYAGIEQSQQVIRNVLAHDQVVYGINTGFGALAHTRIDTGDLETLQRRILLSHAAGVGELLSDEAVRLILALKINSL